MLGAKEKAARLGRIAIDEVKARLRFLGTHEYNSWVFPLGNSPDGQWDYQHADDGVDWEESGEDVLPRTDEWGTTGLGGLVLALFGAAAHL